MSMASSSSIIVAHNSGLQSRPGTRFQPLTSNPISRLAVSKCRSDELSFWGSKARLQQANKDTRKPNFVVYANTAPGVPPASGPPSSSGNPMGWIIGLLISFIIPLCTGKMGPLRLIKNKLENTVQTVEDIVEAVEKVAQNVDKMAEDFADDLPEGKLRDLVHKVEKLAEKTAKTADCLDDVIDKVQEAGDQVDEVVEAAIKEAKGSKGAKQNKKD